MTPEEKIAKLVRQIKKEFPHGCSGVRCGDCPVDGAEPGTAEAAMCKLLGGIEAGKAWKKLF